MIGYEKDEDGKRVITFSGIGSWILIALLALAGGFAGFKAGKASAPNTCQMEKK